MDDQSIRREIWDGKIPVYFSVAEEEVGVNLSGEMVIPEPCYGVGGAAFLYAPPPTSCNARDRVYLDRLFQYYHMLIPRVSYFPLVFDKLEKLYARVMKLSHEDEIWLSAEEQPLKWHYPVGVLYDLYGRGTQLPWNVIVHFKEFPEEQILHCQGKEAMESHFRSKIKEADNLKHRSEIIQSLTPQEFGHLWEGFRHGNFDDFWTVNKKLMLNSRSDHEPFRNIPFCVHKEGTSVFQRLIAPYKNKDSTPLTLEDLLKLYSSHHTLTSDHCVLIHGIEVSPKTPLQWLSEHFSYPDNFLHVCIVPRGT